jgi:hypothetical protein
MTENEIRQQVVDTVNGWVGRNELEGTHKKIIDIYNTYMPHPRGYKLQYTDSWCAGTVSAVAIINKLTDIIPIECSCTEMIALFKKHSISKWEENDGYIPQKADFIFYDWNDNGIGDDIGSPEHVGTVINCTNNKIIVVEGNYQNSVKVRTLDVNGKYIRGFGLPNYAYKADKKIMTLAEARAIVKQKTDFTDMTIKYMIDDYPYGEQVAIRLAELLRGV